MNTRLANLAAISLALALSGCERDGAMSKPAPPAPVQATSSADSAPAQTAPAQPPASAAAAAPAEPMKVDFQDTAMGTEVHMVAFTNPKVGADAVKSAIDKAFEEMRRLAKLMSDWTEDSDVARVNKNAGKFVAVDPQTFEVVQKSLWSAKISGGVFDISFQAMSGIWKFGDAQEEHPTVPTKAQILAKKKLVDYRKIHVQEDKHEVMVPKGMAIGLGGIAKGYIVDQAANVLKKAGVVDFLVQAGGDLYGAGHKPDGSPWTSGIQDPRGPRGTFFATIKLTDHAFSTAGDYARAYVVNGKRYHHIIDPRTGYPATASRSVTLWAPDAFTADAVDDAVFILGPEKGLKLVDSLDGCGAVIVDEHNKVWVSDRLKDQVQVLHEPTDGI